MNDWQKIEAVLFGSGKYLTEDQISEISGVQKKNLKKAFIDLKKHYDEIESSLAIFNENNSWKLNVKEEYSNIVKNVVSEAEMPKAIMETLALIAYKSPVMQSEIIDMRGSGAYDHIGLLEEKGFISKDKFGRTFKIRIAQKFYDYFDIEGDKNLRQMFKSVKKPETLGTLEVYTQPPKDQEQVFNDKILERMQKVEENPTDHIERKKFLEDFDARFDKTKTNIDQADKEMDEFRKVTLSENSTEKNNTSQEETETDKMLKQFDEELDKLDESNEEQEEVEVEEKTSEELSVEEIKVDESNLKEIDNSLNEPITSKKSRSTKKI